MTASGGKQATIESTLPVLYRKPVILDSLRFGKMRLASATDFMFARGTNSVPITVVEFPLVQRHFPIVFTQEPTPLPMAVLGAEAGRNAFVDAKGRWRPQTYIPAYIRRYPFVFLEHPLADGDTQYVLCIDEQSPLLSQRKGDVLYDEAGQPSSLVSRAVEMCSAFQGHYNLTREFGAALRDRNLLVPNEIGARIASGGSMPLQGFTTIDEGRFKALDGATLMAWNRRGWLQLVYSHLLSLLNWREIFNATRPAEPSHRNKKVG